VSGHSDGSLKKPGIHRSASGRPLGKPATSRGHVKHFKKKGKGGKTDLHYDLIVNIDLEEWQLTDTQVAEYKEVFMLFDKDEDGVLTFPELNVVMKSLGQRPSEKELLRMVREVSEDRIYDTIEFNEFLQMLSKQQRNYTQDSLRDAFRIFDKDDDGLISVDELRHIMLSFGEKMTEKELDEMISEANCDKDGHIDYDEFVLVLCNDGKKSGARKKNRKGKKHRPPPTTSKIPTDANEAPGSTSHNIIPSRSQLSTSTSCNGNLMASSDPKSSSTMQMPVTTTTKTTTSASIHHTNLNVDKKNNNSKNGGAASARRSAASTTASGATTTTTNPHTNINLVLK